MIWISKPHILLAFLATCLLMFFHYLSPWFAKRLPSNGKNFISFAGGTAVAYVFLHMLPDLVEYNEPIGRFLISNDHLSPFMELMIYLVAFLGFLIYYGLELVAESAEKTHQGFVYVLHLLMFCLYNFLITYTMASRVQASLSAAVLFTFSMALHFVLTDRKFTRLYPKRFNHTGRFILIFFLMIGWIFSVLFEPVKIIIVAFMVSFLAGSVLLNVFREELPSAGLMNYCWFILGSSLITVVLLLQTWAQSP